MSETMFLLDRFRTQGTLSDPEGIPDPAYSLPATLNWMRALSLLVEDEEICVSSMKSHFDLVGKVALSDKAINSVFEQLLMSLHHLASIKVMSSIPNRIDASRSAIVTWYYGIFHAASAMVAAQDSSYQENHGETANAWDRQFASRGLIPRPFAYRVTTLVEKIVEQEISQMRGINKFGIDSEPLNAAQAFGACMSYLKGSATWRAAYIEDELRRKELKKLGLGNFRTRQAQTLRDDRLTGKSFGFVHQAFRYRGKANYREALFISYGGHVELSLKSFYDDLFSVQMAFLSMAGAFCARRTGKVLWNSFYDDLSSHTHFQLKPADVWAKF